MSDPTALTRVLDELLWALRRAGFTIATSQAIDVVRAVHAVGLDDRDVVREAVAAVVVQRARERAGFDAAFEQFFLGDRVRGTLWDRLLERGASVAELGELRAFLERAASLQGDGAQHLGALLERGPELDRLLHLAGVSRALDVQNRFQLGFFTYRLLEQLGVPSARKSLATVRAQLTDAFGEERAQLLVTALEAELASASSAVRAHVEQTFARREAERAGDARGRRIDTTTFTSLSDAEVDEVRRAVRRFAERLRGGARVRARRARSGRIDPHRTFRRSLATGGVPFSPAKKRRRRERPRLVLLCDVSDSVRSVAGFMLEFVYAAQELFERTQSFVFVSELGETTQIFARESVSVALGHAYGGSVVSVHDNSNYGRVLRAFEAEHLRKVDRHTTVVILGDGRTNYHDDAADVLDRIRERARALVWLCPESRGDWSHGDSAMARYAPKCNEVLEVRCARDLENAARALVMRR
jgi:uncharacterized protein with von Willebrand factor type A (vWA) domain